MRAAVSLSLAGGALGGATTLKFSDPTIVYKGSRDEAKLCPEPLDMQTGSSAVGDSAMIKFNGTGITITSLGSATASLVAVKLDAKEAEDVDMHAAGYAFQCAPIIKRDWPLAADAEHTMCITVVLKGPSPQLAPEDKDHTKIMIANVVITTAADEADSATKPTDTKMGAHTDQTDVPPNAAERSIAWAAILPTVALVATLPVPVSYGWI
ncbi:hypothetical protein AURDEDRAFT_160441 [Auricularia subglabra TFB-10046 SS5]|nr:hypothetical protein AURDEDRAFT_160441 [Auricularia subglabra TFB-10046 SS5]